MEKLISKEIQSDLSKLGMYQIAGGGVGVLMVLWGMYNSEALTGLTILIFGFMLVFFGYSIYCGIICITEKKNALGHSLANQLLQVLGFAIVGFAFKYAAGLYLTIGLDLTESFNLKFGTGISKFELNFNKEVDRVELDYNLVALGLIFWIEKLRKKVKTEIEFRQVASMGES